jgi:hypothetical protein
MTNVKYNQFKKYNNIKLSPQTTDGTQIYLCNPLVHLQQRGKNMFVHTYNKINVIPNLLQIFNLTK